MNLPGQSFQASHVHGGPPVVPDTLVAHITRLVRSFTVLTGRDLVPYDANPSLLAERVQRAPFIIMSRSFERDELPAYGNDLALNLWQQSWDQFTALPMSDESDASAEEQVMWEQANELALAVGHADVVSGVLTAGPGRRIRFTRATIWNVLDDDGQIVGQATLLPTWRWLQGSETAGSS